MKKAVPLAEQLDRIELCIRQGQTQAARHELLALSKMRIERKSLARLANCCRRSGLVEVALKLLGKHVRPAKKSATPASDFEISEYAAALAYLGVTQEARQLLKNINTDDFPEARLFESFSYIVDWEYERALPCLDAYLASPKLTPYQRLVGQANRASALVLVGEGIKAKPLLDELLQKTLSEKNYLLEERILSLMIQNYFQLGEYDRAEAASQQMSKNLQSSQGTTALLLRQWKAVFALQKNPQHVALKRDLQKVSQDALAAHEWELARNCDSLLATLTKSKKILTHLFFCAPSKSYQDRVKSRYQKTFNDAFPPDECIFSFGATEHNSQVGPPKKSKQASKVPKPIVLDAATGENSQGPQFLKSGQLLQKLLSLLCQGYYRPLSYGAMFSQLFPDQYFNPYTSIDTLRQHMRRLRAWLRAAKIPLTVETTNGFSRLLAVGSQEVQICLRLNENSELPNAHEKLELATLQKRFGSSYFSSNEAAACLKISQRSARRILHSLLSKELISCQGQGRGIRYFIGKDLVKN